MDRVVDRVVRVTTAASETEGVAAVSWIESLQYRATSPPQKKTERLVPASASLPTAGSALPPVGRATPLLPTLTQSSSFSCGAGLQSESRLLLCCAPAVYMLAADAAVAAAVFSLEHLIRYCNHTKRCFGPTSRGQGCRLCHAMPNHRPGEVNPNSSFSSAVGLLVKDDIAVLLWQCPRATSCLLL